MTSQKRRIFKKKWFLIDLKSFSTFTFSNSATTKAKFRYKTLSFKFSARSTINVPSVSNKANTMASTH